MIAAIKRLFGSREREYLQAYKLAGHTFYTFKTVAAMPGRRRNAFNFALKMSELGISDKDIKACINLGLEAARQNDLIQVVKILSTLESYVELYTSSKVLFEIGNTIILIDNEKLNDTDGRHTELKRKLFEDNENVRSFFLLSLEDFLKDISILSKDINLRDYLNLPEVRKSEQIFTQLMQPTTLKGR